MFCKEFETAVDSFRHTSAMLRILDSKRDLIRSYIDSGLELTEGQQAQLELINELLECYKGV